MGFVLSEEQASIQRAARAIAEERGSICELRRLRDTRDPDGFSRVLWGELCASGFAGMIFPEALGGAGLGLTDLGLVLEELGRTLAATPLLGSVLLAGSAVVLGGSEAQQRAIVPGVAAGERVLAFAHDEGSRFSPYGVATRVERVGRHLRISGEKVMVLDGHVADALVVVARSAGNPGDREGIGLVLVPARAPGVHITRTHLVDGRNAARVRFEDVLVGEEEALGALGEGAEILDRVLDRAAIGLSAEMLGSLAEAFDRTLSYLKVRKQFGVAIGSFQALKHRAAQMFCEVELCRSLVMDALRAADEGRADLAELASAAKARATDTFLHVSAEAIQMHGGVGVTDELDIGFFLKRARVAEMTLGTAAYHRDRFARLQGY
jgi:alkylation response protein AidB-like acyl-CoA dehydrogenase